MLKFCETVHEDVLAEDASPVCTVRMLGGTHVLLSVSGRLLEAISLEDEGGGEIVSTVTFPHLIRGVFPTAQVDKGTGRAYVLLDGADPFVVVDVATGVYRTIYNHSTEDVFMKRWRTDVSLVSLTTSLSGHFVAMAWNDGSVSMYKMLDDDKKPSFIPLNRWHLNHEVRRARSGPRVGSMAFTDEQGIDKPANLLVATVLHPDNTRELVSITTYGGEITVLMKNATVVAPIPDAPSNSCVAVYVRDGGEDSIVYLDVGPVNEIPPKEPVVVWKYAPWPHTEITGLPSIAAFTDNGIIASSGCGPRAYVAAKSGDKGELESSTDVGYGIDEPRVFPVAHGRAVVVSGRTVTHVEWLRATRKGL